MKKTLVVLMACMLAFGIVACGNDTTKETEETTTVVETTVESEVDKTETTHVNPTDQDKIPGEQGDAVKPDSTIDGYKDVHEKEPSTDATTKPTAPRKLAIEE